MGGGGVTCASSLVALGNIKFGMNLATPFMVFSVMDTICKWPKLDAQRSQSVMSINYQYDTISKHN